jgi:branched-chain amino acid transport system substrate-binding protein
VTTVALGAAALLGVGATPAVAAKKPTGKAIVLFTVATPSAFASVGTAMKAAAKAINDAGGVVDPAGGPNRPIAIEVCDDAAGANAAADCGRKAVSDGALAVVGSQSAYGAQYLPITFNAGIPFVAGGAYDTPSLTNALSYPIINPVQSSVGGFQYLGKALGLKTAWQVSADAPQADAVEPQTVQAYADAGVKRLGVSKVAVTSATSTPDYTPYAAAAASSGAQMITMNIGPGGVGVMKQLLTQGVSFHKTAVMADTNVVSLQDLKPLGSKASGVYFVGASYPSGYTQDPGVKQYNQEMDAYGDKKNPRTEGSMMAWTGVHVIANLVPKMSDVTPAALVVAMKAAGPLQFGPMAPWDWSHPAYASGLFSGLRIFSTSMMVSRVVGSKLTPIVNGFVKSAQPFKVTKAGQVSSGG